MSKLIKSKSRVTDHGEVFTPSWLVEKMLDLVEGETERIDSRFLEPACGSGNFLVPVLDRKLKAVASKYNKNNFEKNQYSFLSLMCIYGIELLVDNVAECRSNLLEVFSECLNLKPDSLEWAAAKVILDSNIVQGDALSLKDHKNEAIVFPEWSYIGKGFFSRRDFKYDELLQLSSFGEGTLFEQLQTEEIFAPVKDYPQMTVSDIARIKSSSS
jgi:hypothetical protein